jgi:hypothetical protein
MSRRLTALRSQPRVCPTGEKKARHPRVERCAGVERRIGLRIDREMKQRQPVGRADLIHIGALVHQR